MKIITNQEEIKESRKILRQKRKKLRKNISFKVNEIGNYNLKNGDNYQRIHYLLKLAFELYHENKILSKMYISLMKDIIKKNAFRVDVKFKKQICFLCNNLILLDENTKINFEGKINNLKKIYFLFQ